MTYDELKRAVVADMERRDEALAFQLRTVGTKAGTELEYKVVCILL